MRVRGMGNAAWSAYRSARVVRNATQDNTKNNQDVVGPVIGDPVPSVCSSQYTVGADFYPDRHHLSSQQVQHAPLSLVLTTPEVTR
jgi:hypothetical protein